VLFFFSIFSFESDPYLVLLSFVEMRFIQNILTTPPSTWSDVGVEGSGTVESEPFLEGASWKYVSSHSSTQPSIHSVRMITDASWHRYIVRLFGWARKYGIRVNLDLHTIPGSQNGL
jgi:hypothetical protein